MKNGLLVYRTNPLNNIFNIGDYIQSLAAAQFFDSIDVFINREELGLYNGEKIRLIMNGWFTHDPSHFPPSNNIFPLYVAFHLNSSIYNILDNEDVINHFKCHQPIGCRDYDTVKVLKQKGIDAFFSGCMTLTLGNTYKVNNRRNDYVYFVDAYHINTFSTFQLLLETIRNIYRIPSLIELTLKYQKTFSIRHFFKTISFFKKYKTLFSEETLFNAKYIRHEIPDSFDSDSSKFAYARELLDYYANARYVITSRIHCALPCLALDTPVMYVENINDLEISKCRLNGLLELFNRIIYSKESLLSTNGVSFFSSNTQFKNKEAYKSLRDKLINICNGYFNNSTD